MRKLDGIISGSRMESAVQGKLACCVRREAKGTPCQSGIAWPTLQEEASLQEEVAWLRNAMVIHKKRA